MTGEMNVKFKVTKGNSSKEVKLSEILKSEKVLKAIKSEFGKDVRGGEILVQEVSGKILIEKPVEIYELTIPKKDFMDAITFVEEHAQGKGLLRAKDSQVEIVDIKTL